MKKVSIAVGNRRLLKLAKFLRTLPRKRFDYRTWTGSDWEGAQDLSCGTTGCALGWAATMPTFRRLGLRLIAGFGYLRGFPKVGRKVGSAAAEVLFGISVNEAEHLFMPGFGEDNATPKHVAKKIERFVAKRKNDRPT